MSCIDVIRVSAFAARYFGGNPEDLRVDLWPLRGGLCSDVARARVRSARHRRTFVVKRVCGTGRREVPVYERLLKHAPGRIGPRLLGSEQTGPKEAYLYLEWVQSSRRWPWGEVEASERVLRLLARAHDSLPIEEVPWWDYDRELSGSAQLTLELMETAFRRDGLEALRRSLPSIRRLAGELASIRLQLLRGPWPAVVLHGDAHTGNAKMRREAAAEEAVLLDWGRSRAGSAMEDVCSWLQSLGFWEAEPKRRHDTLLRAYLEARGLPTQLGRTLRDSYWLAGASNGLAGAIRYHLAVMEDPAHSEPVRTTAALVVRDWMRILVRADACWRN